jgi:hypothetical protein
MKASDNADWPRDDMQSLTDSVRMCILVNSAELLVAANYNLTHMKPVKTTIQPVKHQQREALWKIACTK